MLLLQHLHNTHTHTTPLHMRVSPRHLSPPSYQGCCVCCVGIVQQSNPLEYIHLWEYETRYHVLFSFNGNSCPAVLKYLFYEGEERESS
jgi:hypothetical protein